MMRSMAANDGACEGARIVQAVPPKMKFSGVKFAVAVRLDDDVNGLFISVADFRKVDCERRTVDVDRRPCLNALESTSNAGCISGV
jgi:hypothetical protein